jgi:glycosyltransferase involved in cell wall biosynthesis
VYGGTYADIKFLDESKYLVNIVFMDTYCPTMSAGKEGVSDLIWPVAARLAQGDDDVHVIAPYSQAAAPSRRVHVHQFPLIPPGYRSFFGTLLQIGSAWVKVRRMQGIQLAHAFEYLTAGMMTGIRSPYPVVMTTPDNIDERAAHSNQLNPHIMVTARAAARISALRCDRIIATSRAMEKWWHTSGTPTSRIVNIPLGVETQEFRPIPQESARAQLGLDAGPRVLFVGRLARENGEDYMVRALALLVKRIKNVKLDIVGYGWHQNALMKLTQELVLTEHVEWHGFVPLDRLPLFYNAADVLVLPRLFHATPRVVLQAMACGTPVITSKHEAIEDFIQEGVTGFMIHPHDIKMIAERIEAVLTTRELAARMGQAAREYACRELDWDKLAQRIRTEVYATLV